LSRYVAHARLLTNPKDSLRNMIMIFNCIFYIWCICESTYWSKR